MGMPFDEYLKTLPSAIRGRLDSEKRCLQIIDVIDRYKANTGLVDFSDMLDQAMKLPPLDLDLVVIDEAQDLSAQQWNFCQAVFREAREWYIGGDDDQAIYQWSGADLNHFLNLKAKQQVLDHSYRLPRKIWEFSDRISGRITNRFRKKWGPRDEDGVVKRISKGSNAPVGEGGEWLFLFRNNYMSRPIADSLMASGIPFINGHWSSVNQQEVRALRAWQALQKHESLSVSQARDLYALLRGNIQIARGMKDSLHDAPDELDYDREFLVEKFGLKANLEMDWKDALNIDDDRKLHYLRADARGESLTDDPRIRLSSIHGVKGGEADNVILYSSMSRASFGSLHDDPDSEHRVFYVGATRAKQSLYLCDDAKSGWNYPWPK